MSVVRHPDLLRRFSISRAPAHHRGKVELKPPNSLVPRRPGKAHPDLITGKAERGEEVSLEMLMAFISRLRSREEGQALVEYALIVSLIALVCVGALTLLGTNVNNLLNAMAAAL
jgi:pilus assembly protein Flp/PilA